MGWSFALFSLLLVSLTTTQDLPYNVYSTPYSPYNQPSTQNPNQRNQFPNPYQSGQNNPNQFNPNTFTPFRYDDNNNLDNEAGRGGLPPVSRTGGQQGDRTNWRQGTFDFNRDRTSLDSTSTMITEATYFVVASKMVRPGQLYRVAVTLLKEEHPLIVRASIQRNGVELTHDSKPVKEDIMETLLMKVPPTSVPGEYKLKVEGLYRDVLGGAAFVNETRLTFSTRFMTIYIQLDKPVYKQGDTVRFRSIPINTELKAFNNAIDVYMLDPNGHIMRRWLSRQSNLGTVSLEYQLSDQPVFGQWKIQVIAQGQTEEATFLVEEYYQTRFEVNITMPAFFFTTDKYIRGVVHANYTSGAPVSGNLTLRAIIRPIKPSLIPGYTYQADLEQDRDRNRQRERTYDRQRYGTIDRNQETDFDNYRPVIVEKYFNFDEKMPFWFDYKPEYEYDPIPHLRLFYGVYEFFYPMEELERYVPTLDGMEIQVIATVGERFYDEIQDGYSSARIYNSSIKVEFAGGSPQVFKPAMPITCYIVASYHDNSALSEDRLRLSRMEVRTSIDMRGGGRRELGSLELKMSEKEAVWEYKIDLASELGTDDPRALEQLNDVASLRVNAYFKDTWGERAQSELLMIAHHSPNNHHLKVSTSTSDPQVGEFLIIHVQTNYYIENFNYIVVSKGMVLLAGEESITSNLRTMSISLSAEMAPVSTIIVWHVGIYGEVTADALTFPVNGISRNKFTVFINNKKARTGHKVEVAIYGEPGSYVGLSGLDSAFYTMQAGNELTYAQVLTKMATFDEETNGTHAFTWLSHEGNPDALVYFPSSTYGVDANRTFEYAGLVVFTDVLIPRRTSFCNISQGYGECLTGRCYRLDKTCDGILDCEDGTDEINCLKENATELALFRKFRFNRIQRHYENVWLWRDVNIGPHGRYIFNIPVPARPANWMVSAFSLSPSMGFGMLKKPIEYEGVLPFFINVEMPSACRQGEQIGIRVTVFNYMNNNIEATVALSSSPDYKFVHVEEHGIVRSYNPRTSFGEHQFFIYIKAQDAVVVHMPIVPTRLGDIKITLYASTLIGKDQVTRNLHVEADGVPQYRHQSILLDLSNRAYVFQYMHVNVTETPIIPYDADRYYVFGSNRARVSVVGDVVGPIFPTMPVNATSLLNLPMDSAEQNMFSFAANLYTTLYMRVISQRNRTLEKMSFYHMNIGYQRQLSFMMPDGSFSLFRSDWNQSASSVWLTAYCARVLQEANFYEWENYIYIDPKVISKAIEWILEHQTEHGSFYEVTWLPDRKYNRSLNYRDDEISHRNISLTAHVLITLETVKDLSSGLGARVAFAQQKAIKWLDRNMNLLEQVGDAFEVSIVAYALSLSGSAIAERAFNLLARHARSEGGLMYWGRQTVPQPPYKMENQKPFSLPRLPYDYDSENIEATSYALLTYVARKELFTERIVTWLNSQRLTDGGWASTQDTSVAMKALVEYTIQKRLRDVSSLQITIEATSLSGHTKILNVNEKNYAQLQSIDMPEAWGTVKVQANGAGYAILQMSVQYNVDIEKFQTMPPIKAFDLETKAHFHGRNQSHITYVSCQRWTNLNESIRSGMAVLDVAIPTGYFVQQQNLDAFVLSRRVRNLQRARYQEQKVLFYFDYLDYEETCLNFTVERWHPVANMSRYLPIRVYDYYAPERFNESIFDSLPTYLLNICEVCGSSQCPYCTIYNLSSRISVPIFTVLITSFIFIFRQIRFYNGAVL